MTETTTAPVKQRGIIDVVMALVAAALMMGPSYVASIAVRRLHLDISIAAAGSLVLFLIGAFLLVRVLKR